MMRTVVDVSLDGMDDAEKEWILKRHLGEYLERQREALHPSTPGARQENLIPRGGSASSVA